MLRAERIGLFNDQVLIYDTMAKFSSRLPLWSDYGKLPYINCIIKEGMRIHPV